MEGAGRQSNITYYSHKKKTGNGYRFIKVELMQILFHFRQLF